MADQVDKLRELSELHNSGALTDSEFAAAKAALLAGSPPIHRSRTGANGRRPPLAVMIAAAVLLVLAVVAGVLFLTRDNDPGQSASESASDHQQSVADFCGQIPALKRDVDSYFQDDTDDPVEAQRTWQRAAERFRSVQPPAEIAADWATIASWYDRSAAVWELAMTDKDAAEAEQKRLDDDWDLPQGAAHQAESRITGFLQEQCGIDTSG